MTQSLWKTGGLLLVLLTILSITPLEAQVRCGFEGVINKIRKDHPGYEEGLNKKVRDYVARRKLATARMSGVQAPIYYIPVVVHVIHTGGAVGTVYNPADATIRGAIDYLNAVYNGTWNGTGGPILGAGDIQVQFVLATKDPGGNSTTGINRVNGTTLSGYDAYGIINSNEVQVKNLSRWDPAAYYNVWVVNRIDGADGNAYGVPFTAGYAYFPLPNNASADYLKRDGIVMLASQMKAGEKTLPHEIGHALSLYHPFQGETDQTGANLCAPNSSPSTQGDYCADTDPVISPADDSYGATAFSCRSGANPCSGLSYSENTEKNFMNYTNCYQLFTNDQKARMQASLALTTREGLADSWANNQGSYPTTWSAPAPAVITPMSQGNNANIFGIMNVSLNGKKIYTLNATQDNGYVDNAKWYNLFVLQPGTSYTMDIGLNGANIYSQVGTVYEQVGVWIDYNGDGTFSDGTERIFYNSQLPSTDQITITFSTPSTLSGNIVRMRIMSDGSTGYTGFSPLSGATNTIRSGQAEDYPVFLVNTTPMPVTLLSFSGRTASGNTLLTWKTTQEENAKEFQVQRSPDGSAFTTVGVVTAKGNTSTETTYRFTDFVPGGGTYFYRLKMVDQNESYKYSNVLQFTTEAPMDVRVIGNPFRDRIRLVLPGHNGSTSIRLLDATGKVLISRTLAPSQTNTVDLAAGPSLSKGLYLLEVIVDGKRSVHKLVKE